MMRIAHGSMPYSPSSTAPTDTNAAPWGLPPPPVTTLVPLQRNNTIVNNPSNMVNPAAMMAARRSGLYFVIGVLTGLVVGIGIAVPIVMAINSALTITTTTTSTTTTTTMAPLQWNSTGTTIAGQLSMTSATAYYLNLVIGIWLDSSATLYAADGNNHRIQRFAADNSTGTTVAGSATGVVGSTAARLNYANDIAVDSSGNIFVLDSYNNRVQLWYAGATSGVTIAGNVTAGNSTIQLNSPRGITFGTNTNTFFVSDTSNDRVMMYNLGSNVGTVVAGGTGGGSNRNQLNDPRGLYYESSTNSLLIANAGAHNIVRWVIGASNWTIVAGDASGTSGTGTNRFNGPWDVILDPFGNMYVADRYNHRVQFFLAGQTNGTTVAGATGSSGSSATRLNQPLSVALDSQYNLYVSDSFNNRIQKFYRI